MQKAVIAYCASDAIILWTELVRGQEEYWKRNVTSVGNSFLAFHDSVDAWLPTLKPFITRPNLAQLDLAGLVTQGQQYLVGLSPAQRPTQPLGVVIGGFDQMGRPSLMGLHSNRKFEPRPFYPSISGGLPSSIWDYLVSNMAHLMQTRDDIIDLLFLGGEMYQRVLHQVGMPNLSGVGILQFNESLKWIERERMIDAMARNRQRLLVFQQRLAEGLRQLGVLP